jgi:hypothetical protein
VHFERYDPQRFASLYAEVGPKLSHRYPRGTDWRARGAVIDVSAVLSLLDESAIDELEECRRGAAAALESGVQRPTGPVDAIARAA